MENYKTSEPVTLKVVPVSYQDDDINLYDIYCILARYKTIIGGLLILSILAAAAYLFLATPVYKSEVYLVIPSFNDIKTLNLALEGMKDKEKSSLIPEYSQESVLNTFMFNFNSQAIHREFFGKYSKYNGRLDIEFVNNTNNTRVTVHALSQDPVLVVEGLNQYVDFINLKTVNKLKENIESVLEARRDEINREIASKRMTEKKRKEDFIIVLKEALRIAKKAGITTGISRNNYVGEGTGNLQTGLIRAPLYMRGTKVLSEEISALENRKNDDPFIEGLKELEVEAQAIKSKLKMISSDNAVKTVTVDEDATIASRVSPQPKRIIIFAVLGGLFLGIFIAFFADFVRKCRTREQQKLVNH